MRSSAPALHLRRQSADCLAAGLGQGRRRRTARRFRAKRTAIDPVEDHRPAPVCPHAWAQSACTSQGKKSALPAGAGNRASAACIGRPGWRYRNRRLHYPVSRILSGRTYRRRAPISDVETGVHQARPRGWQPEKLCGASSAGCSTSAIAAGLVTLVCAAKRRTRRVCGLCLPEARLVSAGIQRVSGSVPCNCPGGAAVNFLWISIEGANPAWVRQGSSETDRRESMAEHAGAQFFKG